MSRDGTVAGRLHPVMGAQCVIAPGQVLARIVVQIAERGGQAVAPVIEQCATQCPQCVLQPLGQRHAAFAAENDMRVLEAGIGEPEVIEPVIELFAADALTFPGRPMSVVAAPHTASAIEGGPVGLLEAIGGGRADRGLRGAHRGAVCLSEGHIEPHLVIGDMAAGQWADFHREDPIHTSGRIAVTSPVTPQREFRLAVSLRAPPVGLRPPMTPAAKRPSHPDCRAFSP